MLTSSSNAHGRRFEVRPSSLAAQAQPTENALGRFLDSRRPVDGGSACRLIRFFWARLTPTVFEDARAAFPFARLCYATMLGR